ncbi:hypothetical protein ABVK25_012269 [Lepraria finkii]|uniref:Uncharacterized protein n=1 Tax=Lepraria finkii TaxID=1340010 RepID=A0ABR4AGQ8_9LECA
MGTGRYRTTLNDRRSNKSVTPLVSKSQNFKPSPALSTVNPNELAAKHALQLSAQWKKASLGHKPPSLEELAKTKALSSRKEHEFHQRLRYLDAAHNESLANAASLAQQLHDAKARHGTVDELQRQLAHARREAESAQKTDAVELRRHVSAALDEAPTNMGRTWRFDWWI